MSHGKRGNPTQAISPLSAALLLHVWTLEHGRPPKAGECKNVNGLPHWDTFYRAFKSNNFSAGVLPMASALIAGCKVRTCIGKTHTGEPCTQTFADQGPHIRMCPSCRIRWAGSDEVEYSVTMTVQRVSLRDAGAGRGGWQEWEGWIRDIDWSGI